MNNIDDVAYLVYDLLSCDEGLSWTISDLHWALSATEPDKDITLNEIRYAVWQLIDDVKADLTSDRKVIFHNDSV
jgi:hypothetical protein